MLRFLSSQFIRYRQSRNERRLRIDNENLQTEAADSQQRVADLEEELESERVKNRIQQLEIESLMTVVARNQKRVDSEILSIGEPDVAHAT